MTEKSGHSSIAEAYVAAFAEIVGAVKDAANPHLRSKYADLPAVIAAIKPALVAHGLAFTQPCKVADDGVIVSTILHHSSGTIMDLGELYVPANKKDAQGFGSALTYARRYALVSAFGVPTEDDDGEAAKASSQGGKAKADNASRRQSRPAEDKPSGGGMPKDAFDDIMAAAKMAGVDPARIAEGYKVKDLSYLSSDQYKKSMDHLKGLIAEKSRTNPVPDDNGFDGINEGIFE